MQYSHFYEIHAFAQKGGVLFVVLGTFLSDVRNPRNKAKSACQRAWHLIWSRHTLKILRLEKRSCCLRTNWIVPLTTCLAAPMILFFINWIRPRHQPYNARPRVMKTIVFISSYSFSSSFLKKMGFFGF